MPTEDAEYFRLKDVSIEYGDKIRQPEAYDMKVHLLIDPINNPRIEKCDVTL